MTMRGVDVDPRRHSPQVRDNDHHCDDIDDNDNGVRVGPVVSTWTSGVAHDENDHHDDDDPPGVVVPPLPLTTSTSGGDHADNHDEVDPEPTAVVAQARHLPASSVTTTVPTGRTPSPPPASPRLRTRAAIVSFHPAVHVREYHVTLGDHPATRCGPPIQLDWTVAQSYCTTLLPGSPRDYRWPPTSTNATATTNPTTIKARSAATAAAIYHAPRRSLAQLALPPEVRYALVVQAPPPLPPSLGLARRLGRVFPRPRPRRHVETTTTTSSTPAAVSPAQDPDDDKPPSPPGRTPAPLATPAEIRQRVRDMQRVQGQRQYTNLIHDTLWEAVVDRGWRKVRKRYAARRKQPPRPEPRDRRSPPSSESP